MSETSPVDFDISPKDALKRTFIAKDPHPFLAEVLVSAGPRKSAYEYGNNPAYAELCEDGAGTCWIGERLVFWLCDGASNGIVLLPLAEHEEEREPPPVFGFSARVLAKDLGHAFVEHLCDILPKTNNLEALTPPTNAFAAVASAWKERFATYVSRIEMRGNREKLINAPLGQRKEQIGSSGHPRFWEEYLIRRSAASVSSILEMGAGRFSPCLNIQSFRRIKLLCDFLQRLRQQKHSLVMFVIRCLKSKSGCTAPVYRGLLL